MAAEILPTTWRTRRLAARAADLHARCDSAAWSAMLAMIRKTAPSAIYYAFAGQISVWLISVFGDPENVAQVGALGRLAMVFNIFGTAFSLILVPRFARLNGVGSARVLRLFWLVQLGTLLPLLLIVGAVARYPAAALAVLGENYRVLSDEVVLMAAGAAMALLSGCAYALAAARGVVASPGAVIPIAVALQAVLAVALPISTVAGVLWLGLISNVVFWLLHALNFSRVVLR